MNNLSTNPFVPNLANNMGLSLNPVAITSSKDRALLERMMAHKHMIETIERFKWNNLPPELPQDLIERVLYFRFKGALFKNKVLDRFLFLPFTLKGEIDSYGRYIGIEPVLFTGQWKMAGDGKIENDMPYLSGKRFKVVYDLPQAEEELDELDRLEYDDKAVILTDSSLAISQDYTPMEYLIRPILEQLVDILILVNIDLISSAKMFYIIAKDEDQKEAIEKEFNDLDRRILNGKRVVVMTSATQLQELTGSNIKDTARYFQSYQSIDNLRKDMIGADNGGTFMKQEHTTEMETKANTSSSSLVLTNALRMREDFCAIVNKVWGLNISVEAVKDESNASIIPEGAQTKDRKGEE